MNTSNPNINVLMLGGPMDGQVCAVLWRERQIRVPALKETLAVSRPNSPTTVTQHVYNVNTIVDVKGVHYVAQLDMNACPVRLLIAGYRKPSTNDQARDENMAEQLVTLLGGTHDGQQMPVTDTHNGCTKAPLDKSASRYQIVKLNGKDGKSYRVGVLDAFAIDPIALLIEGYRQ